MYTDVMKNSLEISERFLESVSDSELDALMGAFDHYQVEDNNWFCNFESFNGYLADLYSKLDLFTILDGRPKKSVDLKKEISKDLIEGPFFIY